LEPYVSADFNHGRQSSSGKFNGNCTECKQYDAVLKIPGDASEEAIKSAYRNFVKIYHPDRFEGKNERQTAEEGLKEINEAYGHIVGHFEPARP
jgi:DnaJ-class molecular chaperone